MAATGKKKKLTISCAPFLKNKPETSHPCVDHRSKSFHRRPQRRDSWFRRREADQSEGLTGGRPSPPATPATKTSRLQMRRQDSETGSGKTQDWYSNSVGLGLTVLVQRARTHARTHKRTHTYTLKKGKNSCGDESSWKQSHDKRGFRGLVCV